jgi:tetratricopeptide (TPR) repeat protein
MASRVLSAWRIFPALAVGFSLAMGCAQTGTRGRAPAVSPSLDAPPPPLALKPEQEQKAAALAHYSRGVARELADDMTGALGEYLKAVELDPTNTELALRIARQLPGQPGLIKKAEPALEAATKANPGSADLWFLLGTVQRANGDTPTAVTSFEQALKIDPTNHWSLWNVVELYLEQAEEKQVVNLVNRALRVKTDSAAYWMRLGDLLVLVRASSPALEKRYNLAKVIAVYEKSRALAPDDLEIMVRLVGQYEAAGQTAKATALYDQIVAKRPDDLILQLKLVQYFAATGATDRAIEILSDMVKKNPLRFELYNALAEIYEDTNQYDKAIETFRQSLVLDPSQAPIYLRIVMIQLDQKKFDDALATLATMGQKFPGLYLVPYYSGLARLEQKQYEAALKLFGETEKLAAASAEPVELDSGFYFYYGSALERLGRIDEAAKQFRRSLELKPDNHAAMNYLGYMWAEKGIHLEEAHELITKALELDPESGAYMDSLGWVLYQKGQYAEALKHLKRAAELIGEDAIVYDHVADALIKLGREKEAIPYLRKALELEPDNKAIQEKLQRLEKR